jgi:hypothetical protein
MKHLKKFATEKEAHITLQPNVVLIDDTQKVVYNALYGVFIQHIDGTIHTMDEWTEKGFTNDMANGVAVGGGYVSFVIAKSDVSTSMAWSSDASTLVEGVVTTRDEEVMKEDYAGAANTQAIVAADTDGSSAASACAGYVFPNGQHGYLPAAGEWRIATIFLDAIQSALALIGGDAIYKMYMPSKITGYWTSTQRSATGAWFLGMYPEKFYYFDKGVLDHVRPFRNL